MNIKKRLYRKEISQGKTTWKKNLNGEGIEK